MIKNKQKADETNLNAAFPSRTVDTSLAGVVSLTNTANANSGAQVTNTQRAINETFDAVGMTGEGDTTRKQYSSTNYIANGDSHKAALGKLDARAKAQSQEVPTDINAIPGTVTIAKGGTGQTSKAPAFDALTPATTEGDFVLRGTSASVRFPVGTTGQVITADTTVAGKVKWATPPTPTNQDLSSPTGTLPITNGGTGQTTKATAFDALSPSTTEGDLNVRGSTASTRLPIGTTGQVLTADTTVAGKVKWAAAPGGDLSTASGTLAIANGGTGQTTKTAAFDALSPNTTKGDLSVRSSTSTTRLPIGTDAQVLTADSTQTLGVKWAAVTLDGISPTTTKGDLIVRSATGNTRLPVGADSQYLVADSTQTLGVKWVTTSLSTYNWRISTNSSRNINTGTPTIVYETLEYGPSANYNTTTGELTVPVNMYLSIHGYHRTIQITTAIGNAATVVAVYKASTNAATIGGQRAQTTSNIIYEGPLSTTIKVAANDKLTIRIYSDVASALQSGQPGANYVTFDSVGFY